MIRLNKQVLLACLSGLLLAGCGREAFQPIANENPWADDYSGISEMKSFRQWGPYNLHDPSCLLVGDTYHVYSTDAIFREDSAAIRNDSLPFGYIQYRTSKDLVNWEFQGWAFDDIPVEAKDWVLAQSGGKGASNIWAPYLLEYQGRFRLYYCVSAFALQTSYIGLAEAESPAGPWTLKGCVVKTKTGDEMNAIDPSIVTDQVTGKQWMHYGSYFGGLHCLELNPETGLAMKEGDQGHLIARRYDGKKNNIEAPEIIYHPELKKYYLFVSYDPLMTTYNIRVGRSDRPEGPFVDFFGKDMREEADNYPIITYPYQFTTHPGWSGTGHCSVFSGPDSRFYLAHQARLAPDNHQMAFHIREVFWTEDGWPVLSPQRYAQTPQQAVEARDIAGEWEFILIKGDVPDRDLFAGQILWGENKLQGAEKCEPLNLHLSEEGTVNQSEGLWKLQDGKLIVSGIYDQENNLFVYYGQDWERSHQTLLCCGLSSDGYSIWGKRIK